MSTPLSLRARHDALGARWVEYQGWEVPRSYGDPREEWQRVRTNAGLIDLTYHGILRAVGPDRRTWLHGMVTNEVCGLADGQGVYAAVLNVQGHLLSDVRIYAVPEALLLELPAATRERIHTTLDGYLMMERAEIEDISGEIGILSLQGPAAPGVVAALGVDPASLPPLGIAALAADRGPDWVARVDRAGEIGFDLWTPREQLETVWDQLCEAVTAAAGGPVGLEALNTLRVEAGIPWWDAELDASIVPFEARLEHAISFTKGCYIGQEIIARIEARGRVNNLLVGLNLGDALPPAPGSRIRAGGKPIGRVTSAVHSPALQATIALGFVRREHAEPGTRLVVVAAEEEIPAVVVELPFYRSGG